MGVITWGKGHSQGLGRLAAVLWIFLLWIASCQIALCRPSGHCFFLWEGGGAWAGGAQEVSAHSGVGGSTTPSWSVW